MATLDAALVIGHHYGEELLISLVERPDDMHWPYRVYLEKDNMGSLTGWGDNTGCRDLQHGKDTFAKWVAKYHCKERVAGVLCPLH